MDSCSRLSLLSCSISNIKTCNSIFSSFLHSSALVLSLTENYPPRAHIYAISIRDFSRASLKCNELLRMNRQARETRQNRYNFIISFGLCWCFLRLWCSSVGDFVSVRRGTTKRQRGDSLKEFRSASKKHDIEAVEEESEHAYT